MFFVNLATHGLDATKGFFAGPGYPLDDQFSDDTTASIPLSNTVTVMLHDHRQYGRFTKKQLVDSATSSEVLLTWGAPGREKADELAGAFLSVSAPRVTSSKREVRVGHGHLPLLRNGRSHGVVGHPGRLGPRRP